METERKFNKPLSRPAATPATENGFRDLACMDDRGGSLARPIRHKSASGFISSSAGFSALLYPKLR
jgi:hypothetical protein